MCQGYEKIRRRKIDRVFCSEDFNVVFASHKRHSERSRGCNAAPKLSAGQAFNPVAQLKGNIGDVSTSLDMTKR